MKRNLVYINANSKNCEYIYSGIDFEEFFHYMPIENLLLLKPQCIWAETCKRFDFMGSRKEIAGILKEDIYNFGDFCFVDCASFKAANSITNEEIGALLFLAHMFTPLSTPFFESLNNNFAYLAHDDGFYCKLYCKNSSDFLGLVLGKIASALPGKPKQHAPELNQAAKDALLQIINYGVLIDLGEAASNKPVNMYLIGKHTDIDDVLNNYTHHKKHAFAVKQLHSTNNQWEII